MGGITPIKRENPTNGTRAKLENELWANSGKQIKMPMQGIAGTGEARGHGLDMRRDHRVKGHTVGQGVGGKMNEAGEGGGEAIGFENYTEQKIIN